MTARNLTHGMKGTPTYESWRAMRRRCYDPKDDSYERYGGRGITVCDQWRDSFEAFFADMGERPIGTTLDRYPNRDGNYEPGNCRWATAIEQAANRDHTKLSDDLVREIRRMSSIGIGQAAIGRALGIDASNVQNVLRGLAWNHVA